MQLNYCISPVDMYRRRILTATRSETNETVCNMQISTSEPLEVKTGAAVY